MQELVRLRADWLPDAPPPTVAMGALGAALVRVLPEATQQDLQCLAETVEEILRSGTEQSKNAVATGFLEAVVARSNSTPEVVCFTKVLGPLAREYCREWDKFTGCRTPGVWD
jgi:hypothetical protein